MRRAFISAAVIFFGVSLPAAAQQSADVAKVCIPILINTVVHTIEKKDQSETFKHYVTVLWSKRSQSLDKVKQEGFEVGVVIEGVPISALWSSDEKTRKRAEEIFFKYVDSTLLTKDVREFKEVKDNHFALQEYNRCVTRMVSASSALVCYFGTPSDRDSLTLNVLFRPHWEMSSTKVRTASIKNGFMLPSEADYNRLPIRQRQDIDAALEKLNKGERLPAPPRGTRTTLTIPGGKLPVGTYSFFIYRTDPDKQTAVDLTYESGLHCSEPADPVARTSFEAAIWPSGRDWVSKQETFEYAQTSGCSRNPENRPQEMCMSGQGFITSIADANTYSANCGGKFAGASISPRTNTCIVANGSVHGCGKSKWGDCKGRGWIKTRITVNKDVPATPYEPDRVNLQRNIPEAAWSDVFDYTAKLPDAFRVDSWKFTAKIVRSTLQGTERISLTDQEPEQGGCRAVVPPASDRAGRVVVSCGVLRSTPAALLLPN